MNRILKYIRAGMTENAGDTIAILAIGLLWLLISILLTHGLDFSHLY